MTHTLHDEHAEAAGVLLKRYRLAAELTQGELAERSGVSVRTIGSIERGALVRPRDGSLRLLTQALELTPEQRHDLITLARRQWALHRASEQTPPTHNRGSHESAPARAPIPAPLTSLVGREGELTLARETVLRPETRMLTLYGPPGVGKTRLALRVAADVSARFADGAVFVALAAVEEPEGVLSALAQSLDLRDGGKESLEASLHDYLRMKQILLVLDNCEQVLAAGPLIGKLLEQCPGVKLLATSRELLRISGEHELSVPPLAIADPAHLPSRGELAMIPSITLFEQRARAVKPTFRLTDENASNIAEICARLDGLPLAIELAAARIKLLSPRELLERLDSRLRLLTQEIPESPVRHRTLRDAVSWSYELLAPGEQRMFAAVGVFQGGWTLGAAEAVCADAASMSPDVLDSLTSLIDKSLVQQVEDTEGGTRFALLETIREFALERLAAQGESETRRRRHAEYYTRWAEGAAEHYISAGQAIWLDRTAGEIGNLRSALQWATKHAEGTDEAAQPMGEDGTASASTRREALKLGLRLAGALGIYWSIRGPVVEGRGWLERLLAYSPVMPQEARVREADTEQAYPILRAKALRMAAQLAEHDYDFGQASAWLAESLQLSEEQHDSEGESATANRLGVATLDAGDYAGALEWFERCVTLRRTMGDPRGVAAALTNCGVVALQLGDYAGAAMRLESAITLFKQVGDITPVGEVVHPAANLAIAVTNLGVVATRLGNYTRASRLLKQGRGLFERLGYDAAVAVTVHCQGNLERDQGHDARAEELYRESLQRYGLFPHPQGLVQCLEDVARLARQRGQAAAATRLWGAADELRGSVRGLSRPPGDRAGWEQEIAALQELLGGETFALEYEAGGALTLDEATSHAHRLVASPGGMGRHAHNAAG